MIVSQSGTRSAAITFQDKKNLEVSWPSGDACVAVITWENGGCQRHPWPAHVEVGVFLFIKMIKLCFSSNIIREL